MLLCLCLVSATAAAEEAGFSVGQGSVRLDRGVFYLDAHVDYTLSQAAHEALENGVPLVLMLEIEVLRARWWWWNEVIAMLSQRYRIQYHALSQRYLVTAINSGESRSFRNLPTLLEELGSVRDLPVIDAGLLHADENYRVRLRASLDLDALPRPLRAVAYISPDWRLVSDWQSWRLDS